MTYEEAFKEFVAHRGVETPCNECSGLGTKTYGSTATWHGGAGGQAITVGVCDRCWGTGDEHRKGVNLRAMRASEQTRINDRAAAIWAERTGASLAISRPALVDVAEELERLSRSRKPRPRWFAETCSDLARLLRDLGDSAERAAKETKP